MFNEELNISFHIPKKDQCNLCTKYRNTKDEDTLTENLKQDFNQHQERKVITREEKSTIKTQSKANMKLRICAFDLQAVLYTPCALVSVMYYNVYISKLCVCNLSLRDGKGSCFFRTKTDGMRGSSEKATCLRLYLLSLTSRVDHVILYSDAFTAKNRNQTFASALLHIVTHSRNIRMIDHKFQESVRTHVECDSIHAALEFA